MRKLIATAILSAVVLTGTPASASSLSSIDNIPTIQIPNIPDSSVPIIPTPDIPAPGSSDQDKINSIGYWEDYLFNEMNTVRSQHGLAPYQWDGRLHADGKSWANEMSATNVYYHDPKLGAQNQGENIWMTWDKNPDKSTQVFMDSPGHRANILGPYNKASVSLSYNSERDVWYIVQRFAW